MSRELAKPEWFLYVIAHFQELFLVKDCYLAVFVYVFAE